VGKKATSAWDIYPTSIKIWPFYYILSKKLQTSNQTRIENTPRMEETPGGLLMLNVDASYDEDNGCGSTGIIIRDSHGAMVAATSTYISHLVDAPMAEAYALKEGLMLVQHIGGNRLVVQSDCMEVVEIMMNDGFTANSAAVVYDECKIVWGWGGLQGDCY
jgi:hypothetical protein